MRRLFGTAGIRATYLKTITPELAFNIGLSIAKYVGNQGHIVIGHDTRTTSPLLSLSVASGAMSGGLNVLFLGLTPTPVAAYGTRKLHARTGIVVTASHNPPTDNGFKVFDEHGMEYTVPMELELEELIYNVNNNYYVPWHKVGNIENIHLVNDYINDILEKLDTKKRREPKVIVDCANGTAYNVTPIILRSMGAKVITSNCQPDGFFPGREPEPRPDVLNYLNYLLKDLNSEIALAHDGDADRLSVITREEGFIRQDRIIALFAKLKLEKHGKGLIISSIDTGRVLDDVVEKYGGKLIRWKLGKTHEKLKEHPNALLAAEPWKLIDPEWGLWVDGIYQAAFIGKLIIETSKLDELLKDIPDYPLARFSLKVDESSRDKVYDLTTKKIMEHYKNPIKITTIDGIRLDFEDKSWILVRKSGTEPKIRFYIEALKSDKLKDIVKTIINIINKVTSEINAKIKHLEGVESFL